MLTQKMKRKNLKAIYKIEIKTKKPYVFQKYFENRNVKFLL